MDEDVALEAMRAFDSDYIRDAPLVLQDVVKCYDDGKVAVNGISFALNVMK
jgi:hypothetical protein